MMRISREEEHYIGRARPGMRGRIKVGFCKQGRITALDMFSIERQRPLRAPGHPNNTRRDRLPHVSTASHALARHHRS